MDSSLLLYFFVGFAPIEVKLSPVGIRADLYDASRAAFLTFF